MPNVLAAGTVTGQLILWDIKQVDFSKEIEVSDDQSKLLSVSSLFISKKTLYILKFVQR